MENKEKNSKFVTINREKNEIQTAFDKATACEEKHKERVNIFYLIAYVFQCYFYIHYEYNLLAQLGFGIRRISQ